jgi:hypothetical protein
LTDKGRYCHDGLQNQRLLFPVKKRDSIFKKIDEKEVWRVLEQLLNKCFLNKKGIGFFPGKLVDFESFH